MNYNVNGLFAGGNDNNNNWNSSYVKNYFKKYDNNNDWNSLYTGTNVKKLTLIIRWQWIIILIMIIL